MNTKKKISVALAAVLLAVFALSSALLMGAVKENRAYEAAASAEIEAEAETEEVTVKTEAEEESAKTEAETEDPEAKKAAQYEEALAALDAEEYEEAYVLFRELGDYKDAAEHAAGFFILREGTQTQYKLPGSSFTETNYRELYLPDGRLMWMEAYTAKEPETCSYRLDAEYDSDGTLLRKITTSFTNNTITTVGYDPVGNVISETTENSETGEITKVEVENSFHDNGILQQQIMKYHNADYESVDYDETYTRYYDEHGQMFLEEADSFLGFFRNRYIYDEYGHQFMLLRQKCTDGSFSEEGTELIQVSFYPRVYDEKGNTLRFEFWTEYARRSSPSERHYVRDIYYTQEFEEIYGTSILKDYVLYAAWGAAEKEYHYTIRPIYGTPPA